jgi:PAS domain S-box-containing protein
MSASDEATAGLHCAEGAEGSGELARILIGAMDDGVLVFDADGRAIMANDRAIEITGIPLERIDGAAGGEARGAQADLAGAGGGERAVWQQLLDQIGDGRAVAERRAIEGTGRRADGSEFPFEAQVISLAAGQRQVFVTFVHDISERKAAERRLADARDAALRASVVKSEFLATMSHEIRTPMNGVIGSLDLMLDSELAPELADLAQIARTAANDLLGIIDDILDLSKIEADKVESRRESLDLVAIVEGVGDIVAVTARQKGVGLATYIDPEIPADVRGDSRLLRQVLVNLVGNAVKFTDRGEVVVRAERLAAPESQTLVRFTVRDSGPGIPADAVETLFEPFTQVDQRSSHERGGSGLGLAISSRLVRLMGGRHAVDTELGRGSTFAFELPFETPEQPTVQAPPPPRPGRPLRVLIVDGSDTSAETAERYLRAWGMVAVRVSGPREGLERFVAAAAGEHFDAVIISAAAIEDGGVALARELRSAGVVHGVFLIVLLDIGVRRSIDEGSSPLFDEVIAKPIRQSRLREALAGVASARGAGAQPQTSPAGGDLRGLRVLIAEDNPVNQEVLMRQVKRLGLLAEAVKNGQEVLDALAVGSYDAVLMDCQMPVMDGYTATREIRALEAGGTRRMPVVAVTANAMREDYERCRESGMDDFVAKPVTLDALAAAIARAVGAGGGASALHASVAGAGLAGAGEGEHAADPGAAVAGVGEFAADPGTGVADMGVAGADGPSAMPGALASGADSGEFSAAVGAQAAGAQAAGAAPPGGLAAGLPGPELLRGAIDRVALDSLRDDLGGSEALLRIVRLFLEQLDPQAVQIEREAHAGELQTLARNAHRMKSSAATLGASKLAELLIELEAVALAGDTATAARLAVDFGGAVTLVRAAFEAIVEELDVEVAH